MSKHPDEDDSFTTTVYGSRFAAEDLPTHEMPEKEMPKEVAYRMIKDELSLDGNPMLKYVFFFLEVDFGGEKGIGREGRDILLMCGLVVWLVLLLLLW